MANRRMFSRQITEHDTFLDMPLSTQALYFHLGMQADDDGFVSPRRVVRMLGAQNDDLRVLIAKNFLIEFEDGVVVIKHWRTNNYLRNDRYKTTMHQDKLALLSLKDDMVYQMDTNGIPMVDAVKDSIVKDSIVKDSIVKDNKPKKRFTPPTLEEVEGYIKEKGYNLNAQQWIDYYESKGWMIGKNKMKNWKSAVNNWTRSPYYKKADTERVRVLK